MTKLSDTDVKILEAILQHINYKEAALDIEMNYNTLLTCLSRVRKKVRTARAFLIRMKRYNKALFRTEMKIEVVKPPRRIYIEE